MRTAAWTTALVAVFLMAGCERPPMDTTQTGFRGTAMGRVENPRIKAAQPVQAAPAALPGAPSEGPKASETMQNVKVLGDLSVAEFTRTMQAMTEWVSPKEGCAYCHDLQNLAADTKYTKVVSRRMLEMTRQVNSGWKNHVAATGVTCYTCHRGQNVPTQVWFKGTGKTNSFAGNRAGQNAPARSVAYASLPNDPLSTFLVKDAAEIRVAGANALPASGKHGASVKQAEASFGLMMHMSQSLNVNCTFCHNTRSFDNWRESTPQRLTAWHGIRMARELNANFLEPLTGTFPANRLGPSGDVAKVSCATCHQGLNKPLGGAAMAAAYPALTPAP